MFHISIAFQGAFFPPLKAHCFLNLSRLMFYFSLSRLRFYFISRAGLRLVGSQPWLQYIQAFVSFSLSRFFQKQNQPYKGPLSFSKLGLQPFQALCFYCLVGGLVPTLQVLSRLRWCIYCFWNRFFHKPKLL